jgi:hypothetical protein
VKNPAFAQEAAKTPVVEEDESGDADAAEAGAEGREAVDGAEDAVAVAEPETPGAGDFSCASGALELASLELDPEPGVRAEVAAEFDATWEGAAALCAWQSEWNEAEQRKIADATAIPKCIFILRLSP